MFKTDFKFFSAFAMMLATLMVVGSVSAQEAPSEDRVPTAKPGAAPQDGAPKIEGARRRTGKRGPPRIIELEELVIEGKIQKPEVFYVLGRATSRYRELELERDFVDRIVESVKDNPF